MRQYLDLLREVREQGAQPANKKARRQPLLPHPIGGKEHQNRTGVPTLRVFGRQLRFDLQQGFPMLTTKKLHFPSIAHELLWFISGDTNIRYLRENGVRIWNEWADADGELGPVYGAQWRRWPTADGRVIDQLKQVLDGIRHEPNSRRLLINAWNVGELDRMALPPCHLLFQFVVNDGYLHCQTYQRSADLFLGVPFNIASYALLTHMVARVSGLQAGELILTLGDTHIYDNHLKQVDMQLDRKPRALPHLILKKRRNLFNYRYEDIQLGDYNPHPHIAAPVAV